MTEQGCLFEIQNPGLIDLEKHRVDGPGKALWPAGQSGSEGYDLAEAIRIDTGHEVIVEVLGSRDDVGGEACPAG